MHAIPPPPKSGQSKPGVSRRGLLGASASGAALLPALAYAEAPAQPAPIATDPRQKMAVTLTVNGLRNDLVLDTRTTLLDALRRDLGLTGTKKGCDQGQCGACTVLVGGKRILACLQFATMVREPITTIEGLEAADGTLHPMQQAFIDQDAFQCGYCTPGQIISAIACIQEGHAGTGDEIREYMSGNLCRCAAYPNIVAAIQQAALHTEKEG